MLRFLLVMLLMFLSLSPVGAMSNLPATSSGQGSAKPALDVTLPRSDGTSASLMSARQGGKAILIFWATWCPHCREELERINQLLPQMEEKGIKIILVNVGESREEINAYFERRQINLISFMDEENVLQEPYDLVGIPTVVFVSAEGNILSSSHEIPSDFDAIFTGV